MNPIVGWALAAAALVAGYAGWGWQGVMLAFTVISFWLLLQFNRAMRVMRVAAHSPVGHVSSAVMLHAKLHAGMKLLEVVALTRSLGRRLGETPEIYVWEDGGGAAVEATFEDGRLTAWSMTRAQDATERAEA